MIFQGSFQLCHSTEYRIGTVLYVPGSYTAASGMKDAAAINHQASREFPSAGHGPAVWGETLTKFIVRGLAGLTYRDSPHLPKSPSGTWDLS